MKLPTMPTVLRQRMYDDLPIIFEGFKRIRTIVEWTVSELTCQECPAKMIQMWDVYVCVPCYQARVIKHTERTMLLKLSLDIPL